MKTRKYKSSTAEELSQRTGVPLSEVNKIMESFFTLEDISMMTGVPFDAIKKRAKEESWPYKTT